MFDASNWSGHSKILYNEQQREKLRNQPRTRSHNERKEQMLPTDAPSQNQTWISCAFWATIHPKPSAMTNPGVSRDLYTDKIKRTPLSKFSRTQTFNLESRRRDLIEAPWSFESPPRETPAPNFGVTSPQFYFPHQPYYLPRRHHNRGKHLACTSWIPV